MKLYRTVDGKKVRGVEISSSSRRRSFTFSNRRRINSDYSDVEDETKYNVYCTYDDNSGGETDGDPRNNEPILYSQLKKFVNELKNKFLEGKLRGSYIWSPIDDIESDGEEGKFYIAEKDYEKFVGEGGKNGFMERNFYGYRYDDDPASFNTREEAQAVADKINNMSLEEQQKYRFHELNLKTPYKGTYEVFEGELSDPEINTLTIECLPLGDYDSFIVEVSGDGEIIRDDLGLNKKSKKKGKKSVKSAFDSEDFFEIYPYGDNVDPHSDEDLGLSAVIEVYGDEFVNVDDNTLKEMRDMLELYFDDEAYVRDWNIMNSDYQIESIEEVGSVEDLEINDLARYFDYDAYGRTMRIGDGFYWDDDKNCWTNSADNLDQSRKSIKSLSSGCHGKSKKNKKQLKSSFEDAVQDGYNDYLEGRYENPYDPDEEPDEYEGWEKGYERARRKESDHIGGGY